jgi:hypothetical protein
MWELRHNITAYDAARWAEERVAYLSAVDNSSEILWYR